MSSVTWEKMRELESLRMSSGVLGKEEPSAGAAARSGKGEERRRADKAPAMSANSAACRQLRSWISPSAGQTMEASPKPGMAANSSGA